MGRHSKSTTSWYLNTANMAKKRKASGRFEGGKPENGFESKGGKMGPITTYEDVADSEDEFHINRDKVLLDEGPEATTTMMRWKNPNNAANPRKTICPMMRSSNKKKKKKRKRKAGAHRGKITTIMTRSRRRQMHWRKRQRQNDCSRRNCRKCRKQTLVSTKANGWMLGRKMGRETWLQRC